MPREHRRKALLVGAMLGTLPDLDVFIDFGDAVRNFTYHRGFSHSLFILPGAHQRRSASQISTAAPGNTNNEWLKPR